MPASSAKMLASSTLGSASTSVPTLGRGSSMGEGIARSVPVCAPSIPALSLRDALDGAHISSAAYGPGFGGSIAFYPTGKASPTCSGVGRSAISYANVVAYEADIILVMHSGFWKAVLVVVCNPIMMDLDSKVVDEISTHVDDFSSIATIFQFKGFWPCLSNLHAWISHVWEPLILDEV